MLDAHDDGDANAPVLFSVCKDEEREEGGDTKPFAFGVMLSISDDDLGDDIVFSEKYCSVSSSSRRFLLLERRLYYFIVSSSFLAL